MKGEKKFPHFSQTDWCYTILASPTASATRPLLISWLQPCSIVWRPKPNSNWFS